MKRFFTRVRAIRLILSATSVLFARPATAELLYRDGFEAATFAAPWRPPESTG